MQVFLTPAEHSLGFKLLEIIIPERSGLGHSASAPVFQEDEYWC